MSTSTIRQMLVAIARAMYGDIAPIVRRESLSECFDEACGRLYLYFNTRDNSTHVVSASITNIPKGT